jgi:hypothetical protein
MLGSPNPPGLLSWEVPAESGQKEGRLLVYVLAGEGGGQDENEIHLKSLVRLPYCGVFDAF